MINPASLAVVVIALVVVVATVIVTVVVGVVTIDVTVLCIMSSLTAATASIIALAPISFLLSQGRGMAIVVVVAKAIVVIIVAKAIVVVAVKVAVYVKELAVDVVELELDVVDFHRCCLRRGRGEGRDNGGRGEGGRVVFRGVVGFEGVNAIHLLSILENLIEGDGGVLEDMSFDHLLEN